MAEPPIRKIHTSSHIMVFHSVPRAFTGKRVDLFLQDCYPSLSRAKLQRIFGDKRVRIDRGGRSSRAFKEKTDQNPLNHFSQEQAWESFVSELPVLGKPSKQVFEEDFVVVITPPKEEETQTGTIDPSEIPILFENKDMSIVSKPPGLAVHATGGFLFQNLITLLKDHHKKPFYPCHRIDRETSGVLVLATHPESAAQLSQILQGKKGVFKEYLAIVEGHPSEESFQGEGYLLEDPHSVLKMKKKLFPLNTPLEESQKQTTYSLTSFKKLKTWESQGKKLSLIQCLLHTGRQHQIRAHLFALGFPVLGDKLYGKDDAFFIRDQEGELTEQDRQQLVLDRHALHAWRLTLPLETPIGVESHLPHDFLKVMHGVDLTLPPMVTPEAP